MEIRATITLLILALGIWGCKINPHEDEANPYNNIPHIYHDYMGEFCYDNTKLKLDTFIKNSNKREDKSNLSINFFDPYNNKINDHELEKMTIKEKLLFTLYYPEYYNQTCSYFHIPIPETHSLIYKSLPRNLEGKYPSKRQEDALIANKDSIQYYLKDCLVNGGKFYIPVKRLIVDLKFIDFIPLAIERYQMTKDPFLLTMCMEMMQNDFYFPYLNSDIQNRFKEKQYLEFYYILKNDAHVTEIITHAKNYYNSKKELYPN